jgi:hypothetical protein
MTLAINGVAAYHVIPLEASLVVSDR